MQQYLDLVQYIMNTGTDKADRTGTGTRSVFGHQMRFDLSQGFPLVTAKFTPFRLIATELLWFLQGNPDIRYLHEHNNHIWDEWVKADGTFGPIYGQQWRSWPSTRATWVGDGHGLGTVTVPIDQIANVIERLKTDPDNRRLIVSAWNVADVESGEMALPPCHALFQFYSAPMSLVELHDWVKAHRPEDYKRWYQTGYPYTNDEFHMKFEDAEWYQFLTDNGVPTRKLSCQLYQRSADVFLGVPFNIASYALLTHMIAQLTNHAVGEFVWTGGDVHLYHNHFDQVRTLLQREPKALPQLWLDPAVIDIDAFTPDHMGIIGYEHHPAIKAPVAV